MIEFARDCLHGTTIRPSASRTTASELPANRRSVNTSSVANRRFIEFHFLIK